ncbi:MAG: protein kinase domain-containing protein [Kiloniellales bacterium]
MNSDQDFDDAASSGQGATFAVGALLSHTYEVQALLARGGMGEVYRTRHAEIGTEHAIKMIRPELAGDPKIVELFRREAATLRTVRDEAVVSYDGVLRDEAGRVYLIMEFVDGPSLTKRMTEKPLTPSEVRRLRDRLARGLAAAHERGVIHRDMSPDNVILGDGRLENAKIIDFGIAKLTDSTATTIIGDEFAGRYAYASPEQFGLFGGKVDARSDIYSLGLVLAAAALGRPLFQSKSNTSLVAQIEARQRDPDLSALPGELRVDLEAMLHADPDARPQSMRALLGPNAGRDQTVVSARLTAEPLSPLRGTVPAPKAARKPLLIAAAGAVAAIAVAAVAFQSEGLRNALGLGEHEEAELATSGEATMPSLAQTAEELAVAAKLAAERAEEARLAAEQAAAQKAEAERLVAEKAAAEQAEVARLAAEKADAERLAAEKAAADVAAAERLAAEKAAAERAVVEKAQAERVAAERAAQEQAEAERRGVERAAAEKELTERLAAERAAADKALQERLATEREAAEKALQERRAAERLAAEKAEAERLAAEQAAAEKAEAERLAAEKAAEEKAAEERLAAEKADAEKAAAEKAAAEKLAAAKALTDRLAAEKAAEEKALAERVAAEKAQAETLAAEEAAAQAAVAQQAAANAPTTEVALVAVFENSLSRDERREIQRNLKRLAQYNGAIDGDIGPGTRAAIRTFQNAIGVEASGYLDAKQMARLETEAAKAPPLPATPANAPTLSEATGAAPAAPAAGNAGYAPAGAGVGSSQQAFARPEGPRPGENHIDYLLRVAEAGDLDAQTELGLRYYQGRDLPKDYEASARWNRMAAEGGDARAQSNLGILYMQGHGVRRDEAEAVRWFRASAEQGHPQAQFNLGVLYEQGRAGLERDYEKAALWYARAAAQGYRDAENRLSALLSRGVIKERPKI